MPLTEQSSPFIQTPSAPGVINLGLGQPSPRLLPIASLAAAAAEQLRADSDPLLLQYGAVQGHPGVRASLARVLSREYAQPVAADELLMTGGISMALSLVSEVFGDRGRPVVCEDPTYFLACGVFASAGLAVEGVPVDADGLDVDALERRLATGLRPAFVYCIPAYQNPTGVCLAPERAARLVDLAERHDFLVVADEPYVLLHYGPDSASDRPGSLTQYDRGRGRVLSLGSFSKLLGPGLRLGWAHGAPALIERLSMHGSLRSGGAVNPLASHLVWPLLDDGRLLAHVAGLRAVFGERSRALTEALRELLPAAQFHAPEGGYFCWVDLGDDGSMHARAKAEGVRWLTGDRCAVGGAAGSAAERELGRFGRLSFAFYEAEELVEGVRRIARCV